MRWKAKLYYPGIKIIEKFLLFPMCIEDEWRWLEKVKYEEKLWFGYFTGRMYKTKIKWIK